MPIKFRFMLKPGESSAPHVGLGDIIAKATKAVGIQPCEGCKKRQEALNKLVSFKIDRNPK